MATKLRNVRVGDEEWAAWETAARDQGVTVSEFVRDAVAAAVAGPGVKKTPTAKKQAKAAVACARERFHRPGTFCKSCGKTT